jgi:putative hydrolase
MSNHAFSTIEENAIHAKEKGLEAIAMTDHFGFGYGFSAIPKNLDFGASLNMEALPQTIHGVRILSGTEIDIVDFDGHLAGYDAPLPFEKGMTYEQVVLEERDVAIASVHRFDHCKEGTVSQNTRLYCLVAENPKINIIGHCIRSGLPFDIDEVLQVARKVSCLIEINEHSFDSGEPVICEIRRLMLRCAEMGVNIVVSSDAHSAFYVGEFTRALGLLEEIHFPQELIANLSLERFLGILTKRSTKSAKP